MMTNQIYENASGVKVVVAKDHGTNKLRLDFFPLNGMVYASGFKSEDDLIEYLALGGHVKAEPFLLKKCHLDMC